MQLIYLQTCWNTHGIIIPILQIRKLRLKEVGQAAEASEARLSQSLLNTD